MGRGIALSFDDTFSLPALGVGFRPEFLDFKRGIRVGNLEDNERITRILKLALEARYGQQFVTERWGRGVHWRWIGFLTRANRAAKPISSNVSFGCAKFFVMLDTDDHLFKCGMQVERGFLKAPRDFRQGQLRDDWDWHRVVAALKPNSPMERELKRLVGREGFCLHGGTWDDRGDFPGELPSMRALKRRLVEAPANHWAGFQVYYAMTEDDVRGSTGLDLVESIMAIFGEVTPLMNLAMQAPFGR
ncbi:MAG: hypothetical protein ACE14L_13180 [Terriglobales bacterium]